MIAFLIQSGTTLPLLSRSGSAKVALGIGDQAVSSLTNLIFGVAVARQVDAHSFGVFAMVFALFTVFLTCVRAVTTDPLTVRFSAAVPQVQAAASASATGASLVCASALGTILAFTGFSIGDELGRALLALGIGLPALLLQDAWRFVFLAAKRPGAALINDTLCLVSLAAGLVVVQHYEGPTVWSLLICWAAASSVSAVAGCFQGAFIPRPRQVVRWLTAHKDLSTRYVAEAIVFTGSLQVVIYSVAVVSGVTAAGAFRSAQILMGPINVLTLSVALVAIPHAVRLAERSLVDVVRLAQIVAGALGLGAVGWCLALVLLPTRVGQALLGSSWEGGRSVLVPLALGTAGVGVIYGANTGIRALQAAARGLRARTINAILVVACATGGASAGGAVGAATGFAVGSWISALVWWFELVHGVRERRNTNWTRTSTPRPAVPSS